MDDEEAKRRRKKMKRKTSCCRIKWWSVLFPTQTASRSVWDIIAGEDPQKKQVKLNSRAPPVWKGKPFMADVQTKDVEFMLVKIGAMQAS